MTARLLRSTCLVAIAAFTASAALAQDSLDRSGALEGGDKKIPSGEFADEYVIEGRAGDLLDVRVSSDDFDTFLIVDGPDDTRFENDDASDETVNSRIIERLPQSGSYRISVTSYEPGETGTYSLQASTSAASANSDLQTREVGELANGDGRMSTGEYTDAYTFQGVAGDFVELTLNSGDFDTYLMLRGPGGANFENDDVEPGNTNSAISEALPASGEYTVTATSYAADETGSYQLDATGAQLSLVPHLSSRERFGDAPRGEVLTIGTPLSGVLSDSDQRLETGEYFDVYLLRGEPGSGLSLQMESDDVDTYLAAYEADGFEAFNDDRAEAEAGDTNSLIEMVIPASGMLTIAATSYGEGEVGRYTLRAEPSTGGVVDVSDSTPIALGDRVEGTLIALSQTGDTGFQDSYYLQVSGQQEVDFTLTSGDFDTYLSIEGPGGFSEENDDDPRARTLDSRIRTVLPTAGIYRITVSSYEAAGSGAYRLETVSASGAAEPRSVASASLTLGEKVTGTLASGDNSFGTGEYADHYSFEGERGQRLTFEMESNDFDTYLSLNFPGGGQETNDDRAGMEDTNSRLSITLPEDGTYDLAATSYAAEEVGTYTLSMTPADESIRTVSPTSSGARVFALSVGVADYERLTTLDLTDRDALKLSQTLGEAGVLAPESVTLVNSEATRENFVSAFQSISTQLGPDDLFLVFFSGHGDKVEGVDTEMDGSSETIELFDTALHDYELADMFANVDARTLLVIDACFSGGFDNIIDQRVDRMGIFSSDSDVLSLVAEKFEAGGYVSLLMRQALEGEADTNGDMAITAGELSEFMRRGFYRIALEGPLDAGGEDFRGEETLGYQHLIVDRGGDGMPYGQVLMRISGNQTAGRTGAPALSLAD